MRDAIRNKLIAAVPEIGGRCFEPHAAEAKTDKPYCVVTLGEEFYDGEWTGCRRIAEIWPCIAKTTFGTVDSLSAKVITALHTVLLTTSAGEQFNCIYTGNVGRDAEDLDLGIITRGLRFEILAIPRTPGVDPAADDTWLEAIVTLSTTLLDAGWTVYKNIWPQGYKRPAALWRLANIDVAQRSASVYEVKKRLIGHVLGDTPNRQIIGVATLIQGIGKLPKIQISDGGRYMTVRPGLAANFEADAIRGGQIVLPLSRLTNDPVTEMLMMHVGLKDHLQ